MTTVLWSTVEEEAGQGGYIGLVAENRCTDQARRTLVRALAP